MAKSRISQTIDAILASRGVARLKDALTTAPSDNAAESPSSSTTVTGTTPQSPRSSKAPSTSAEITRTSSAETTDRTPLTKFSVASLLLGPRPLPEFSFDSPGGEFVLAHAKEVGVSPADMLEHMVSWAYRVRTNFGDYSLEELALFYKDNRPEWWIG